MSIENQLLTSLNEAQQAVVSAPVCNQLVLAGAGSGKTRVLVQRIAWLIQVEQVSPYGILAVTFTNKAAAEMRNRVEQLLGIPARGMWIGTFHGLAHRLLRAHWREAGLEENFQILDSEDQKRLLKRVIKSLDLDEDKWPAKQAQWFINGKKDEGLRPQHLNDQEDIYAQTMKRIYQAYQDACERGGLVDFAELLLRSHELWLNDKEILQHYQQRFAHILIDEFQDTNAIQYAWVRILAGKQNTLMVVGDDDQSIYGWRGAKIENIHRFQNDYPDTQVHRLEQNYRSTGTILQAANALIANNGARLGKSLWTSGEMGEPISLYAAYNDLEEARFIVERITQWVSADNARSDVAILYRSNAQSRVLEEELLRRGVPYRVYGGLRFFERAEIKHALAYLRLLLNRNDDAAFERIVNMPVRGIGERTMGALRAYARDKATSLWQAACALIEAQALASRASRAVNDFVKLIDDMAEFCRGFDLHVLTEHVLEVSGLLPFYQQERGEKAQARVENLQELITATRQFVHEDTEQSVLNAFLAHAALEAGEGQGDEFSDCVQLMTLHSAKGLEFPIVFLCGIEEGLFPHYLSIEEPGRLEEERRLCYVGMTRAMQRLCLSYAESRRMHGHESMQRPSRFIAEIPPELMQDVRVRTQVSRPSVDYASSYSGDTSYSPRRAKRARNNVRPRQSSNTTGLDIGQRVKHSKFGLGTVLDFEGDGNHTRVQVRFENGETKWLVASYAKLETA